MHVLSDRRKNALRRILRRHVDPQLQRIRPNRSETKILGIFPVKFLKGRHDLTICMATKYISGEPKPTCELSRYVWTRKSDLAKIHPIGGNYLKMVRTWWKARRKQQIG